MVSNQFSSKLVNLCTIFEDIDTFCQLILMFLKKGVESWNNYEQFKVGYEKCIFRWRKCNFERNQLCPSCGNSDISCPKSISVVLGCIATHSRNMDFYLIWSLKKDSILFVPVIIFS